METKLPTTTRRGDDDHRGRRSAWLRSGAIVVAVCATFELGAPVAASVPGGAAWWSDMWWLSASLVALVSCIRVSRRVVDAASRAAWRWFAVGCGCFFAGMLWWSVEELILHESTPFPSGADFFFLGLCPSLGVGAFVLQRDGAARGYTVKLVADIGLISVGVAMVALLVLYQPTRATSESGIYVGIALAYAVTAASTLVLTFLWSRVGRRADRSRTLTWFTWINGCFAVVDLFYADGLLTGVYVTGAWLDGLWVLGFLLVAAVGHHYPTRPGGVDDRGASRVDVLAPAAALAIVVVTLAAFADRFSDDLLPWFAGAGLLLAAFVALRAVAAHRVERALAAETARRHASDRALDAQLATIEQHKLMGTLATGAAHDFNNLLQAMTGQLALLRRRLSRGQDVATTIEEVERALARASEMAARLLALGRSGPAERVAVDPEATLRHVATLVMTAVPERVAVRIVPTAAPLGAVDVVASELTLALLNLALNARDALRSDGGTIELSVESAEFGGRPSVVFVVRDDGIGMSPTVASRALDPFFTTKPLGQGAGLGLPFVAAFASRHAGSLRIVPVAHGTELRLLLPRSAPPPVAEAPPRETDPAPAALGTVLMVSGTGPDDLLVRGAIERAGFDVIVAGDVDAATRIIDSGEPLAALVVDVAFVDATAWSRLAVPPDRPRVAVAASSIDIPADVAVLSKPVEPRVVVEVLRARVRPDAGAPAPATT